MYSLGTSGGILFLFVFFGLLAKLSQTSVDARMLSDTNGHGHEVGQKCSHQ